MRFSANRFMSLYVALGIVACARSSELPEPGSPEYSEAVSAFYTGVAAVQVGESGLADASFQRLTELVPREPAGWADRGINALGREEPEQAAQWLRRARELAPEHSGIQLASALVAREQGRLDTAAEQLRRAIELDTANVRALYLLAEIIEQQGDPSSAAEAGQLMDRILAVHPGNLAALGERARLAAKAGDAAKLSETLDSIEARTDTTTMRAGRPRSQVDQVALAAQLSDARSAAEAGDPRDAATQITFLQTGLRALPEYAVDESRLRVTPGGTDALLTSFVALPTPSARPSPPDTSLTFTRDSLSVGVSAVPWVRAVWLGDELPLAFVAADADTLWVSTDWGAVERFPFPAGASAQPPSPAAVAAFDYDYDFRLDLAVAGPGGMRLLRQADIASFTDVTTEAIPAGIARGAYSGVWSGDVDMDGDMDLIAARAEGPPLVLRNRGDGTFESYAAFDGMDRVREFVWADLDDDGDPDAALLDADGRLHVYLNGRHRVPQFEPAALPDTLGRIAAIAAADLNKDATLELVAIDADGRLSALSMSARGWVTEPLGQASGLAADPIAGARLFIADIDNNGDLDLVASTPSTTHVWLSTAGGLHALEPLDVHVTEIADIGGEGRLDLIGVSSDGRAWWLANEGSMDYFATSINPRAASATGDRRINSFGIGGEIEIRAGLLYQKQLIDNATVHFGLGEHADVDVARIIWPNGTVQAEFDVSGTNQFVTTLQRLKGSCPWVFAFDGTAMRFVTDFLWRTALGLRINAQGETAVMHGEDWIRIRGDQLAARDGFYDIGITADLWETHYFDHVALMVVDHPDGTEAFVDERFTQPAPEPTIHVTQPPRPIARAVDDAGRDVTALVRELDERYLDTFELGPYQGITEAHYVEVTLGDDAPANGPLWLVASGWVYPTDASINVAVTQGENARPRGLQLEVPDGRGGWMILEPDIGFPSGKTKTILIDLSDAFPSGAERRVRLRTNMEVYWDRIAWAAGLPDARTRTQRLMPDTAELRYRGFSTVHQAGRKAPEVPDYDIATRTPIWRDLVGYYTRFGDVRELNETIDDRYVIMNAGDELRLRFPAPPPPGDGWTRDFVLIGDGWVKDGDYNTGYSETVRPLPYHGLTNYSNPPGRLEDDPGYLRHPEDWKVYHTRYVTPRPFHRALVPPHDE